jgi:hypothetical protein
MRAERFGGRAPFGNGVYLFARHLGRPGAGMRRSAVPIPVSPFLRVRALADSAGQPSMERRDYEN